MSHEPVKHGSARSGGFRRTSFLPALCMVNIGLAIAAGSTLKSIEFAALTGDQLQFQFQFDGG
ncbi:MAG: hypothetical protein ACRESZ_23265, partial [Methylococcales bacterium]